MRFQIRSYADTVALESHCIICDNFMTVGLDLLDYRKKIMNSDFGIINLACPVCGMNDSLYLVEVL
jgi:hypothetical protein